VKDFYLTQTRELQGYCIAAVAPNETTLRKHIAKTYGKLWCSVYTEKPPERLIGEILYIDEYEGEEK